MASAFDLPGDAVTSGSAVSWGAILAGAVAAAALSLILLILGTGLGLSSVSPWVERGADASTVGISTVLWLTLTQLLASGMGGYLAGRLRTRWPSVHTDEVYFRDTAHGFMAWAVASLVTAALLTSVMSSIIGGGVQAGASVARAAVTAASSGANMTAGSGLADAGSAGPTNYFVESLFRKDSSATDASSPDAATTPVHPGADAGAPVAETSRIFMNSVRTGNLPPADSRYVSQLVAQRTGLSQADAEKRVSGAYSTLQTKLRDAEAAATHAAETARKASAYAALWMFVTLLIGAFAASLAATYGGRRRDL